MKWVHVPLSNIYFKVNYFQSTGIIYIISFFFYLAESSDKDKGEDKVYACIYISKYNIYSKT